MNTRALTFTLFAFALGAASPVQASYVFCPKFSYTYNDQGLGEDYLIHTSGQSSGRVSAVGTWTKVYRNGTQIWQGRLDPTWGCTDAVGGSNGGTYKVSINVSNMVKATSGGNVHVRVRANENSGDRWIDYVEQLPGTSATEKKYPTIGVGETVTSVAAVVAQQFRNADHGFVAGEYLIYADQNCDDPPNHVDACFRNNAVFLGTEEGTNSKLAHNKYTVGHELGHIMRDRLFGAFGGDYEPNLYTDPHCICDHVVIEENRAHCLQSAEEIGPAMDEGFSHFVATDIYNDPSQSNPIFTYYKQFLLPGPIGYLPPPVAISTDIHWEWYLSYCGSDYLNEGTELDWLTFFYQVKHKGSSSANFSYDDLANVIKGSCGGGPCDGLEQPTWNHLALTVISLHGLSSPKTSHFGQAGNDNITP